MKKLMFLIIPLFFFGCATYVPHGAFYTSGKMGLQDTGESVNKTGRACMNSLLGLFSYGDGSIAAAKVAGGINEVSTIDYEVENILGIWGEYCTVVRGS